MSDERLKVSLREKEDEIKKLNTKIEEIAKEKKEKQEENNSENNNTIINIYSII